MERVSGIILPQVKMMICLIDCVTQNEKQWRLEIDPDSHSMHHWGLTQGALLFVLRHISRVFSFCFCVYRKYTKYSYLPLHRPKTNLSCIKPHPQMSVLLRRAHPK